MMRFDAHRFVVAAFLAVMTLALTSAGALAQATIAAAGKVEITADNFSIDEGSNKAVFTGSVVIRQPDLTVWANKVVVNYGDGGPSDLKDFEALGNVRIRQPEQSATAERGVYDPKAKILRLLGNVIVTNESGTVQGPELVVNLASGKSEFIGKTGGRVTGIFVPQQ